MTGTDDRTGSTFSARLIAGRAARALRASICGLLLSALLAPDQSPAGTAPAAMPEGCGAAPTWVAGASLLDEARDPLPSCFSNASTMAEALVSIADNRSYAELVSVRGAAVDMLASTFGSPLEGGFARSLADSSSAEGPAEYLLGPRQRVVLALERPPPGAGQEVVVEAAQGNPVGVAALAYALVSEAAERRVLPGATESCVAAAVARAAVRPRHPERALRRMHSCVNGAPLSSRAKRLLVGLADRLLRGRLFEQVVHLWGTDNAPTRSSFTIAATNPNLINPHIQLDTTDLGTLPGGRRTIRHLSASGGAPPYRFYIVPEPGGPGVPSWLELAPGGTLVVEPPAGTTSVSLPIEVVDANGEHSVVPY